MVEMIRAGGAKVLRGFRAKNPESKFFRQALGHVGHRFLHALNVAERIEALRFPCEFVVELANVIIKITVSGPAFRFTVKRSPELGE